MKFDFQLGIQAILHFVTCVLCFVVAIPLGLTMTEFDGHCTLYTEFTGKYSFFTYTYSSKENCNYPIYVAVVTLIYSLVLGIVYIWRIYRSKEQILRFQIWEAFIIATNALTVIFMLVACCMISVGLKSSCDSFLKEIAPGFEHCSEIDGTVWTTNGNGKTSRHFYGYPNTSQIAGWITFLMCVIQMSLCILRFVKHHRNRSRDMAVDGNM